MAHIETVKLLPAEHHAEDAALVTISLLTTIKFHALDVSMNMEYVLHLFLFNAPMKRRVPVFFSNWENGELVLDKTELEDKLLEYLKVRFIAQGHSKTLTNQLSLKNDGLSSSKSLSAFAYLVPALSSASKWSNDYHFDLELK